MEKKKIPSKTRILVTLVLGGIFLIGGLVVSLNEPWGNTPKEIQQVEDAINKEFAPEDPKMWVPKGAIKIVDWEKIEEITSPLVYENQKIAKAKALLHFENNPVQYNAIDGYLWENRFNISKQDWNMQSFSLRILTSTGVGLGIFFTVTIITHLMLIIVPWLWYFLLDRVGELSQAIRGR